jgi:hypothetical protein
MNTDDLRGDGEGRKERGFVDEAKHTELTVRGPPSLLMFVGGKKAQK